MDKKIHIIRIHGRSTFAPLSQQAKYKHLKELCTNLKPLKYSQQQFGLHSQVLILLSIPNTE
jgi:hypothetical protein